MRVNPLVLTRDANLELPYRSWRIALELLGIGTALVGSIMRRPQFLRQVSRWSESRFGMGPQRGSGGRKHILPESTATQAVAVNGIEQGRSCRVVL